MVNIHALDSDSITVTIFGDTLEISKDYIESRGPGDFTWVGSNTAPAGAYSLSINGVDLGSINIISPDPNLNALDGASGDASGLTSGIQTTNATGIATPIPPTHDTKEHGISGQAE